jgi:A/G-specific adenine glycosylase
VGSPPLTAAALAQARAWFETGARSYPWSAADDPYAIWISEVMLQQTVVTAAVAPYLAWMARWPDLASLAAAGEDEVLRAWEGLGYASRARNLHRAARELVGCGRTTLPDDEAELRALPGVGEYTAAALLSFAFHRPALTLDANLKRVFQRLGGDPAWTPAVEAGWRSRWAALVDGPVSRASNLAVMQLGQRVCRAKAPACGSCPLAEVCTARREGTVGQIPEPKTRSVTEKSTTTVFWHRGGQWWLAKPDAGRFSNLWLAPPAPMVWPEEGRRSLPARVHTYTRYRDLVTPFAAPWTLAEDPPLPPGWTGRWSSAAEAKSLGMVSTYRRILEDALAAGRT